MFLHAFNYFRGIAILFIVAGHCYWMIDWTSHSFPDKVIANLVNGGTSLFVFISGFLFHHIFYRQFNYRRFMLKKAGNVLLPYMILSSLGFLYIAVYLESPAFPQYFYLDNPGPWQEYLRPALLYLWTGRILPGYWYIPFIMITFLLSPLHTRIIELPVRLQLTVFLGLMLVTMLVQRPVDNISVLQSVVYFTPVYILGILSSIHRQAIHARLVNREWLLLLAAVILAMLQVLVHDKIGSYHKPPLQYAGFDIMMLQKICLCLFFMVFLQRFEHARLSMLQLMASGSFAIYFLHPWVLYFIEPVLAAHPVNLPGGMKWLLLTLLVTVTSLLLASIIKQLAGSRSRYLIGW
jgi:surface polysaccharide O-acyltransferase-like enzyme